MCCRAIDVGPGRSCFAEMVSNIVNIVNMLCRIGEQDTNEHISFLSSQQSKIDIFLTESKSKIYNNVIFRSGFYLSVCQIDVNIFAPG